LTGSIVFFLFAVYLYKERTYEWESALNCGGGLTGFFCCCWKSDRVTKQINKSLCNRVNWHRLGFFFNILSIGFIWFMIVMNHWNFIWFFFQGQWITHTNKIINDQKGQQLTYIISVNTSFESMIKPLNGLINSSWYDLFYSSKKILLFTISFKRKIRSLILITNKYIAENEFLMSYVGRKCVARTQKIE
jgi:hypothetical protein